MWPWEHLAFGYVWLALGSRGWNGRPPSNLAAVALAVGTQFPDLVDKPLAWVFGILPSGVSLGHSILFAVPVAGTVLLVAEWRNRRAAGTAFLVGGTVSAGYMLWPLVPAPSVHREPFLATVQSLWVNFVQFLGTPRGQLYFTLEVVFLVGTLALWVRDGTPGIPRPGSERA